MYKLEFYSPKDHADIVKNALFNAGAGSFGPYQQCSWSTEGLGQFRASESSNPYLGEKNTLTQCSELKIEILVPKNCAKAVIDALIKHHPYEQVAYFLLPCVDPATL